MTLDEAKDLIEFAKTRGLKHVSFGQFSIEFFERKSPDMALDPVSLSKILTDTLPPDSAMLFASAEDMEDKQEGKDNAQP